ncbi:hypothetical protein CAL7102_03554 [Dulcicalothrix desertica PCC 7102]|nr:hypothetical protein CAL7102_03554 [Dulcicalothrix desertica PCC 7102]
MDIFQNWMIESAGCDICNISTLNTSHNRVIVQQRIRSNKNCLLE